MQKKKKNFLTVFITVLVLFSLSTSAFAYSAVLKQGMKGSNVSALQKDLKSLGYFNDEPTGYYGDITRSAVIKFQSRNGLTQDGIAGPDVFELMLKLSGKQAQSAANVSRGDFNRIEGAVKSNDDSQDSTKQDKNQYLLPWFGVAEKIFARGTEATVYDIDTGLSFNVKRTYGDNHADTETLTKNDTAIMKKIFGGSWNWQRRAIIVTVNGKKIAASMSGVPHAGVDAKPANATVDNRSAGYGRGVNLDAVKGNDMEGHFDIHFLGSRTTTSNRVDAQHQNAVKKAAEWAAKN